MANPLTGRNSTTGNWLLAIIIGLPALSYPLSWLPKSWAHFRYDCALPLPEMVLAAGLLISIGWFLHAQTRGEMEQDGAAILLPRVALLPLLAIVISSVVSTRFSEHSPFGLRLLPRLAGNPWRSFLLAARVPRERLAEVCRWWMITAVIVAGNGLLRLGSEPEFISTLGNWDFLATYLAASLVITHLRLAGWDRRWQVASSLAQCVFAARAERGWRWWP